MKSSSSFAASPSATMPARDAPIVTDRVGRIEALDILRGFALLGMILVHFHASFRTTTPGLEHWHGEPLVGWVVWWGVEQKAAATFAFLFGVGFVLLMRRLEQVGPRGPALYLRRLAVLAVIGIALEALTGYAILITLALWGVPLLLVRNWSTRALLMIAVAALLAGPLYSLGLGVREVLGTPAAPPAGGDGARAIAAEASTYAAEVSQRLTAMQRSYLTWRSVIPSSTFTLFLLGLLAVRHRIIVEPRRHVRLIAIVMVVGVASWLMYWVLLSRMPAAWHEWSRHGWPIRHGLGLVSDQWLAFTYIGAMILLLAYHPVWIRRLAAFGLVGRMALTNYVLQATVIFWLASQYGLGLRLRPYYYALGAALLFSALVMASQVWMAWFRFGPLEWVWRGLTHLDVPALRRQVPAPIAWRAVLPFAVLPALIPILLAAGVIPTGSGVKELPRPSNLGFESSVLVPWRPWPEGAASITGQGARSGRYAGRITRPESWLFQRVGGLKPRTTYSVRGYVRTSSGNRGYLYAKGFGGPEIRSEIHADTAYGLATVTFTTDQVNTTAEIGVHRLPGAAVGDLLVDDVQIVP